MRFASAAIAAALLLPAVSMPVLAHHSFAMFDRTKVVTVSGKVREFQWANPHAYIQLTSTDDAGKEIEWSLEMGSPMYLYARGWRPRTLRPGSEVTVRLNPLHSGAPGGVVLDVSGPDGQPIGTNQ